MRHLLCQPNLGLDSASTNSHCETSLNPLAIGVLSTVGGGHAVLETQLRLAERNPPIIVTVIVTRNIPQVRGKEIPETSRRQSHIERKGSLQEAIMAPVMPVPESVTNLSDDQLRAALLVRGLNPGPIVTSTRYFIIVARNY